MKDLSIDRSQMEAEIAVEIFDALEDTFFINSLEASEILSLEQCYHSNFIEDGNFLIKVTPEKIYRVSNNSAIESQEIIYSDVSPKEYMDILINIFKLKKYDIIALTSTSEKPVDKRAIEFFFYPEGKNIEKDFQEVLSTPMSVGKYKGESFLELYKNHKDYLDFLYEHLSVKELLQNKTPSEQKAIKLLASYEYGIDAFYYDDCLKEEQIKANRNGISYFNDKFNNEKSDIDNEINEYQSELKSMGLHIDDNQFDNIFEIMTKIKELKDIEDAKLGD